MGAVWVAGARRDCLLVADDAEVLVAKLRALPPERYPHASSAASQIAGALAGDRESATVRIDSFEQPAVLRALEELLAQRRGFSQGIVDLLEILLEAAAAAGRPHQSVAAVVGPTSEP